MPTVAPPMELFQNDATKLGGPEVVAETWQTLGTEIQAVGTRVFVRTEKPPEKRGSLYLPPEYWDTFGRRLGGTVPVSGVVLSIGGRVPAGNLEVGERVFFARLPFGWTHKLPDGTFVGWVHFADILGKPEGDDVLPFQEWKP